MIPYLTLGVCLASLLILLGLCWVLNRPESEQEETNAVGFRFEPQQDPYDDGC